MKNMQIAYSFDRETIKKIFKGAVISACGAGAIAFLEYIGQVKIENQTLALVVAWGVPTGVNIIREFVKGK